VEVHYVVADSAYLTQPLSAFNPVQLVIQPFPVFRRIKQTNIFTKSEVGDVVYLAIGVCVGLRAALSSSKENLPSIIRRMWFSISESRRNGSDRAPN
jgi:hypothetical protein